MVDSVKWSVGNPGSPEAAKAGCRCPVLDNCRGQGIGCNGSKFGWWTNGSCPVHANDKLNSGKVSVNDV